MPLLSFETAGSANVYSVELVDEKMVSSATSFRVKRANNL